jgi:hypothetical protein
MAARKRRAGRHWAEGTQGAARAGGLVEADAAFDSGGVAPLGAICVAADLNGASWRSLPVRNARPAADYQAAQTFSGQGPRWHQHGEALPCWRARRAVSGVSARRAVW